MKKIAVAVLLSAAFATPAFAADNGFYAGITVGQARTNAPANTVLTKSTDTIAGVLAGYQFNKYWGAEAFYSSAGRFTGTNAAGTINGSGKGDVWGIDAVGTLPLSDTFAFYGKLGVASVKTKGSGYVIATGGPSTLSGATRSTATYGLGFLFNITPAIGIRLGWDRYGAAVTGASAAGTKDNFNVNAWTVGGVFRF